MCAISCDRSLKRWLSSGSPSAIVQAIRCAGPPAGDSVPASAEDPPPPEVTVITTSTAAGSTPNRSRNVRQVASRSVAISSGEGFLAFETTRK